MVGAIVFVVTPNKSTLSPSWLLSGVYYVEVPDFVGQDENNLGGCIEFCRFNAYSQAQVESEFMVIKPEPGTAVLFHPSCITVYLPSAAMLSESASRSI